ncbi:uncharacterized protein LOC115950262 [Quercus lobata]|uniref:uncharacterized protein LOC115950262 n=1 Tax=Quercus lobata TaxID=97700 RepID=UPI0012449BA0|nr:uncharacterized protein LOC115950262 [Quercus lobata]
MDENGNWHDSIDGIVEVAMSYFKNLYSTSYPTRISEVLDTIPTRVTEDMNQLLIQEFTREEVEVALKQMHPTKAPGSNAFELMHYLEHKKDGREGVMAIKLDMSKAYNRVEWELFLQGGDPISPYMFLLCADGFSSLINNAVRNQRISGVSICRGCPKITHLFFVDDSLLFCKVNSQECQNLIDILQLYKAASGQKINVDKSSVFFSNNTSDDRRCEVLNMLGPMQDTQHKKYLGLPSIIGKSKVEIFAEIKERVEKKLSRWKEKMLSVGGQEILIKAVAQAIPTYTMSCFQIPKSLCDEIEEMMRKFWWGQRGQESKIAWVSWKKMCKSKLNGGMGFRNLQAFNLAMLAKQAKTILNIPLNHSLPEDQIIWVGNKRGEFNVKSAYYIAVGVLDTMEEGESSSSDSRSPLWKKLWHLNIPPKVRIFAWKMCMNALPTFVNLQRRGVNLCDICPACGKEPKSNFHVFVKCEAARKVWSCWVDSPVNLLNGNMDIIDITLKIVESGTSHDLKVFFGVAWAIWYNRNKIVHEASSQYPDQKGREGQFSVEEVEALAMECGLILAKEQKLSHIILEFDALTAVTSVTADETNGCLGHVYQGIRSLLSSFSSWNIKHVKRDYNRATH